LPLLFISALMQNLLQ